VSGPSRDENINTVACDLLFQLQDVSRAVDTTHKDGKTVLCYLDGMASGVRMCAQAELARKQRERDSAKAER